MTPDWVNAAVTAFGRLLGLQKFALNERGAAGARFENGLALYLEYVGGALAMSVGATADESAATAKRLLALAHFAAQSPIRCKAVRIARTGEARFVARLAERDLTPTSMMDCFHALWQTADYFRRGAA